ncbi:MAG: hypothetical protein V3U20_01715 [Thermoplasmata archaeon]
MSRGFGFKGETKKLRELVDTIKVIKGVKHGERIMADRKLG